MDASDFFSSGGVLVKPPKRIIPASRGNGNFWYYSDQAAILAKQASGTHLRIGTTSLTLFTTSNGNTVATHAAATLGAGLTTPSVRSGSIVYDSTNGFYYGIAVDATQVRLFRVTDTAGTVSNPGAAFTPTTIGNWLGVAYAEISGGNLVLYATAGGAAATTNLFEHRINLSTGAIVSQDQAVTLSDGTVVPRIAQSVGATAGAGIGACYITADKSAFIQFFAPATSNGAGGGYNDIGVGSIGVAFAKGGQAVIDRRGFAMPNDHTGLAGAEYFYFTGESVTFTRAVLAYAGELFPGWRNYDRVDFDRYVKAIIKAAAGV